MAEKTDFLRITVFFFIFSNDKDQKFRVVCRDIWNAVFSFKCEFFLFFRDDFEFMLYVQYYSQRKEFLLFKPFCKFYYVLMSFAQILERETFIEFQQKIHIENLLEDNFPTYNDQEKALMAHPVLLCCDKLRHHMVLGFNKPVLKLLL